MRELVRIAKKWEREHVIPHCPVCKRPCCKLDDVVLDLDWQQTRELYAITTSRKHFDENLPSHIRTQGERYYAHGAACPAYVETKCAIYEKRPASCRDFPIYEDGDAVTVDTRCEAVDLDAIEAELGDVVREPDAQFPQIVSFVPRKTDTRARRRAARRRSGKRSPPR